MTLTIDITPDAEARLRHQAEIADLPLDFYVARLINHPDYAPASAADGDPSSREMAALASAGGAFDWLHDEPELYDDSHGEPLR